MSSNSFTVSWKLVGHQEGLLTCLSISPKATRLLVASADRDLLIVETNDGHVTIKLCFEKQFSVLDAFWYTETNAVCGCSNGSLYIMCVEPTDRKYLVTMSPFLNQFNQQIRSLAFDATRRILAVGYSNAVSLFTYETSDCQDPRSSWKPLDIIKGPCNNESALVNTLLFYPTEKGIRNLLVCYAEVGWTVWDDVSSVKQISPDLNHNVCRIGRATLTTDEKAIAISTLDHTIAIYALGDNGPITASMKEYPYDYKDEFSPIVPIASTQDGLTLGGTTCGELPVIENERGDISLMRHEEPCHVIRVIAVCIFHLWPSYLTGSTTFNQAHGDKIIVGSSSWAESIVKCYSSSPMIKRAQRNEPPPVITVTEALSGWLDSDERWEVIMGPKLEKERTSIGWPVRIWLGLATIVVILVLSADPPNGVSFGDAKKESTDTDVFKPNLKRHEYWVLFGVRYFLKYFLFQHAAWSKWATNISFSFVSGLVRLIPEAWDFFTLGVAKWMCERVQVYKDLGVCPRIEY
ncbi:hypothetical protein FRC12_016836 [Ceratobasidium sp. 428]|nr:hypothetical protein FRC12_016836 [Ceratobasidium sp. 428]